MESRVFKIELLTGGELLSEEDRKRPSSRPSPGGRRRMRPAGFEGMGRAFARAGREGSDSWA